MMTRSEHTAMHNTSPDGRHKAYSFTLSDTLFACVKAMAKIKNTNASDIVSLCIMEKWEKTVEAGDREKLLEQLAEAKKEID